MIRIISDNKPTLQIYVNQELMIDDTMQWKRCAIEPVINTECTSIVVFNKGNHSFTANSVEIAPNSSQEIFNK